VVYLKPFDEIRIAELTVCEKTLYPAMANQGYNSFHNVNLLYKAGNVVTREECEAYRERYSVEADSHCKDIVFEFAKLP